MFWMLVCRVLECGYRRLCLSQAAACGEKRAPLLCLRIGGLGGKSDAEAQDGRRACR